MKRIIFYAICVIAAAASLASCKKTLPDGECSIKTFSLQASLNSSLSSDINGVIDQSAKTITLVIPASVSTVSFIPSFEATKDDVVYAEDQIIESGVSTVTISSGVRISAIDAVSGLEARYTLVVNYNDGMAELCSVVFKQEDNSLLSEDVFPWEIAEEMIVRVPSEAFRKELVLTVEAGDNDAIKVNNTAVESGSSIKVDTSFPIDITVTDEYAGASAKYVLKVGKILGYVISKLGTYAEGTVADFSMALNPNDKLPYFAYTRKVGDEKYNGVSIAKWDGSAFALVGPSGIADNSARAASKPKVAFGKDGSVYAYYLAGDVASKPTVRILSGEWNVVGTAGITPQNCNSSYLYPFFVHPATGRPAFFWNGNTKNQASYRVMNYAGFSGDAWSVNVVAAAPALGSGGTTNSGMYYTSSAYVSSEKVFIGSSFNEFGYYVHEVAADGTLTPIVENFLPAGAPYGLPGNLGLAGITDDELYLFAADAAAGTMQIYSVDKEEKTLKPFGAGLPVTIAANGNISTNASFGVSPATPLVMAVADQDGKVPGFFFLNEGLQWDAVSVDAPVASKSVYYVAFNQDGYGYAAYLSADGIELYGVGLEADILPE
ncbi:MAG: hypothetical protein IJU68_08265 [Bacteroidales bacterium]|nr:hypothetical protein [Bacteroidales bacterium]